MAILTKSLFLVTLSAVLASSCVTTSPSMSPAAQAAAVADFSKIDWGVLKPYIDSQYVNAYGNFLRIRTDATQGALLIELHLDGDKRMRDHDLRIRTMLVRPLAAPDTFHLTIKGYGFFSDHVGRVRIAQDGRVQPLDSDLSDLKMLLTDKQAEFEFGNWQSRPMQRDMYHLANGRTVPVSFAANSQYQRLRAGKHFGIWEDYVGKTFVGPGRLLKVAKDEANNLVFEFRRLTNNSLPGRYVISRTVPDVRVLRAPNLDKVTTGYGFLGMDDRLAFSGRGSASLTSFGSVYLPRGKQILMLGHFQEGGDATTFGAYFEPLTQKRLVAAMAQEEKDKAERERASERERRAAARRAEQNRATEQAVIRGMSSGFAQAQRTNERYERQTRDFERNLNQNLRRIEDQKSREREDARRQKEAAQLMAQINAERKATSGAAKRVQGGTATVASVHQQREQRAVAQALAQEKRQREEQERREEKAQAQEEVKRQREETARLNQQKQELALKNHLAAEKRGIRLQVDKCSGTPTVSGGAQVSSREWPIALPCITRCAVRVSRVAWALRASLRRLWAGVPALVTANRYVVSLGVT